MITQYILLVLGIAALLAALVLLFRPWRWLVAAIPAFVGLVLLHKGVWVNNIVAGKAPAEETA